MIDPEKVAFDIDSVVADTMYQFIDIAKNEFNFDNIQYEDITSYTLEECLNMDYKVLLKIIDKMQEKQYTSRLKPIDGAPRVLTNMADHGDLLFVTARPCAGPISEWLYDVLNVKKDQIKVVATNSFEGKVDVLYEHNISWFIEDRLETCVILDQAGINPVLFKQPWNRKPHSFIEVDNWKEIEKLIGE